MCFKIVNVPAALFDINLSISVKFLNRFEHYYTIVRTCEYILYIG